MFSCFTGYVFMQTTGTKVHRRVMFVVVSWTEPNLDRSESTNPAHPAQRKRCFLFDKFSCRFDSALQA